MNSVEPTTPLSGNGHQATASGWQSDEARKSTVVEHLKRRARKQRILGYWSFGFFMATVIYGITLIQLAASQLAASHSAAGNPVPAKESSLDAFIYGFLPRVTLIVIVMFTAQFFLSVFRYAVRMASHNEVRSDVLLLSGPVATVPLKDLMTSIAPDHIEFGKESRAPQEFLADLAKVIAGGKSKA